jgi:hypothetical protein
MRGIYYWGCRFDSFLPLLLSVPYYIHTSLALFPYSPCHLSLLACRSLCIIVCALDICVRPPRLPFSAFCTHITLRRRSKRFRRFKRWVWLPCGTHAALTRPTGRQRSPRAARIFFRDEAPIGIAPVLITDGVRSRGGLHAQVEGNHAMVGGGGFVNGPQHNSVPYGATNERDVYHGRRRLAIA